MQTLIWIIIFALLVVIALISGVVILMLKLREELNHACSLLELEEDDLFEPVDMEDECLIVSNN